MKSTFQQGLESIPASCKVHSQQCASSNGCFPSLDHLETLFTAWIRYNSGVKQTTTLKRLGMLTRYLLHHCRSVPCLGKTSGFLRDSNEIFCFQSWSRSCVARMSPGGHVRPFFRRSTSRCRWVPINLLLRVTDRCVIFQFLTLVHLHVTFLRRGRIRNVAGPSTERKIIVSRKREEIRGLIGWWGHLSGWSERLCDWFWSCEWHWMWRPMRA